MKKLSFLLSLITLIILSTSCKKEHSGCQPQKAPCPDGPRAIGMSVSPQGLQVGSYIFDITIFYTNPGADSSGRLQFLIEDKEYAKASKLQHADNGNPGIASFTIALAVDSFSVVALGYNTPQRCDCDPTVSSFHFEPAIQKVLRKTGEWKDQ